MTIISPHFPVAETEAYLASSIHPFPSEFSPSTWNFTNDMPCLWIFYFNNVLMHKTNSQSLEFWGFQSQGSLKI